MAKKNNTRNNAGAKPLKNQVAGTEQSQKRLKNKLKELSSSEERYRRLFETAQDGILLLDADTGKISDVNPFLIDMLGYSKNEFLNKHLWEIGAFSDIAASRMNFLELQNNRYVRYENLPLETKTGGHIDVEFVSNVYLVGGKKVIQCNVRNISERAKASKELKEATDFYESLVKYSPYAIVIHRDGLLKFVNPKGIAMLGAGPDDVIVGQNISRFIHPEYMTMVAERLRSLEKEGVFAPPIEEVFLRMDGSPIEVEVVTAKISYDGKPSYMSIIVDISQRKNMERELLAAKEEKFRTIFESATDGILLVDIETKRFYMGNRAFCNMVGYSRGEVENMSVKDIHPEEDLSYVVDKFEKQVRGEIAIASDIPVKRKDGTVFFADINSAPVIMEGKRYLLGFFRDLTERRKADDMLRLSERKYRQLVETLQEGVWAIDREANTSYINPRMAEMLGYTVEEMTGKPLFAFMDERGVEIAKYNLERRKLGVSEQHEFEFLRKDGSRIYAQLETSPLSDDKGNYTGALAGVIDITERKQDEYKIKNLNRQIEFILGATKTGLDIIDSEYNLIYVDPEWKKIYGDNTGRKCYEYFMDRSEMCPNCGVKNALETKQPFVSEEILRREGNRPVQVTTIPFQDDKGNWLVAEVNADISERKIWEEEKRHAAEAKASTEIRNRFTSMVSHELRSPLSAIKEGVAIVTEGLVGQVNDQQKKLLDLAKRNIDRLSRLINNVLDFQKIELGKMEYNMQPNSVDETINEVVSTMDVLAREKGLSFATDIGENIPEIEFDKDKIIQVLTNLVSNAIKVMAAGTITVAAKRKDNTVCVSVKDEGRGIKNEDLEKLFNPFEQLVASDGRQKGGTGLGLAISKEIILAHDGNIWVESEEGRGSVFYFTLPIVKGGWRA